MPFAERELWADCPDAKGKDKYECGGGEPGPDRVRRVRWTAITHVVCRFVDLGKMGTVHALRSCLIALGTVPVFPKPYSQV